jgi:hypothetical protein
MKKVAILLVACACVCTGSYAQTATEPGTVLITGRVLTTEGEPIPHESVTMQELGWNAHHVRTVETGAKGEFAIRVIRGKEYGGLLSIGEGLIADFVVAWGEEASFGDIVVKMDASTGPAIWSRDALQVKLDPKLKGATTQEALHVAALSTPCLSPEIGACQDESIAVELVNGGGTGCGWPEGVTGPRELAVTEGGALAGWVYDYADNPQYGAAIRVGLYLAGERRCFVTGDQFATVHWTLLDGGRQFAVRFEFPYRSIASYYELFDAASCRMLGKWTDEQPNEESGAIARIFQRKATQ